MNEVGYGHEVLEPLPLDRPVVLLTVAQEGASRRGEEAARVRLLRHQRPEVVTALLAGHTGSHQTHGRPVHLPRLSDRRGDGYRLGNRGGHLLGVRFGLAWH